MPNHHQHPATACTRIGALFAAFALAGCANLGSHSGACATLDRGLVDTVSIQWVAADGVVRTTWRLPRHNAVAIAVRGSAGLTMGIGNPWYRWCRLAPESELERWLAHARVLRREAARLGAAMPAAHGELMVVSFWEDAQRNVRPGVASPLYVEVTALTPAGLEAARALSCLARQRFGSMAEGAIVELTPQLSSKIGYPSACPDAKEGPEAARLDP